MQFHQSHFSRSTTLSLRPYGLHVCQRDSQGRLKLEVELAYEDLLPLRLEPRRSVPQRPLLGLLLGLLWVVSHVGRPLGGPLPPDFWLWTVGGGLGLLALVAYGLRNWWRQLVLHTPRLRVVLPHRARDRRQLHRFTAALEARAKAHLRQQYGQVNPLRHIEPQLRRLAWLRELDVLSPREVRALTTRLTGQESATRLRGLGQELQGLFVN